MKLKPSSFHTNTNSKESLDMLLQDKLISFREEFEEKSNHLVNIYERSQALELAKLVNNEELKIPDDTPSPGSDDYGKAQKLAVELTLLQVGRRKLISSIIAFTGGVTSFANGGAAGFAELLNDDDENVSKLIDDDDEPNKSKSDDADADADDSNTANSSTTAANTKEDKDKDNNSPKEKHKLNYTSTRN
ncbi:unnamed protein product [Ambrosiozyma monospora]|uniref:Unnamed protein product n=1 Tax=Ambrosiozyma monospora TaxID=43982 RepID=A0A9W6T1X5_AMBMO|nr:unnamed protein product [Ambrosiozyma monospora]